MLRGARIQGPLRLSSSAAPHGLAAALRAFAAVASRWRSIYRYGRSIPATGPAIGARHVIRRAARPAGGGPRALAGAC
jgi:hypothetical protein